jgi:RNA recognition motif-containing protein
MKREPVTPPGETRLYIGNIPFSVTECGIRKLFSRIGVTPSRVNIPRNHRAHSNGYAFANLVSADAQRALDSLNGHEIGGRKLRVEVARPQPVFASRPRAEEMANLRRTL